MSKRVTITRKVQLLIDTECKGQFIQELQKWRDYQYIVRKSANIISSHIFLQDNISDFFYLTEDLKLKYSNVSKDPEGILTTSKQNATYQVLSKHFKGEIPSSVMTGLNQLITKTYSQERSDVRKGNKSLRSYRNNIPIPITKKEVVKTAKELDDRNYSFKVYKTNFRTFFGRDRSNNKEILSKAFNESEGYKLHDSSIAIESKGSKKVKFFLLAVVSLPKTKPSVDPKKEIHCFLDPLSPILIGDKRSTRIGTSNDFLHGRLYIQKKLNELQSALKYTKGGKGRKKKLQAIDRFKEKEKNFVKTKMHTYSRHLINYCLRNKIGKIVLSNYTEAEAENDNEDKTLIRNWTYYGLSQMIMYKASMNNIEVVIPKSKEENKKSIEKYVES